MCGIAGIVVKNRSLSPQRLEQLAKNLADQMPYRGPDDSGVWVDPDGLCALSHRRLSIIDTSAAGHQPMAVNENGAEAALTYNGELYNFLELKHLLEAGGERFKTRSDTEVLFAALRRWGAQALHRFDAMFAFGFYNRAARELLLARDAFGEKPLYYVETTDFFAFASELHCLLVLPGIDVTITEEAIATYLVFQYVPYPETIYKSIRKLPPGCYLRLDAQGTVSINRYFSFCSSNIRCEKRSLDDLADELESILLETIRSRLISDVPLGAFLSGGVDSSTVAAVVTKGLGIPLKTFSMGWEGRPDSEHFEAAEIARFLGTEHNEQVLRQYPPNLGEHIASVLDEPNGDSSCVPTFLVSKQARQFVTVAISGDGGDEMFGGYGRYFVTVDEDERKRSGDAASDLWNPGAAYLGNRILLFSDGDLAELMGYAPEGLLGKLSSMRRRLDHDSRPLINSLRETDALSYLPGAVLAKVDRMSMQHSLEVRAPLLGINVARFAMKLSADACYSRGEGKRVLKRLAARYLPEQWIARPKRGFGLPIDLWDRNTLVPQLRKLFSSNEARLVAWISRKRLLNYVDALDRDFHAYQAWSLFVLEIWLRHRPALPG